MPKTTVPRNKQGRSAFQQRAWNAAKKIATKKNGDPTAAAYKQAYAAQMKRSQSKGRKAKKKAARG